MFPTLFRVRQNFPANGVGDLPEQVLCAVHKLAASGKLKPQDRVAITAGSRGIARIAEVIQHLVHCLTHEYRVQPFIIPAMGSHGGATPESQQALLEGFGIRADTCGCPIHSSLDTIVIDETKEGVPIHADRWAWEADHIVLVNRVKPHTDFNGPIQSGLVKMLLLGLGKYQGAQIYHRAFQDYGFDDIVQQVVPRILGSGKVLGGIALVENARKELAHIEGVPASAILQREPELLRMAQQQMARLPVQEADLLIIDEIGKNVSGTGMDTNVVGRKAYDHLAGEQEWPKIRHIAVRGLTQKTHGNATGIGIAEFCLERAVVAMDRSVTTINCVTSGHVTAGMIPLVFESDRDLVRSALSAIGLRAPTEARVVWIRNTADLAEIACSSECRAAIEKHPLAEIVSPLEPMPFDEQGMLPQLMDWWS